MVSGGLVGINLDPKACAKFCLIAPELARQTEQAKNVRYQCIFFKIVNVFFFHSITKDCLLSLGMSTKIQEYHHNLTTVLSREEKCASKLASKLLQAILIPLLSKDKIFLTSLLK